MSLLEKYKEQQNELYAKFDEIHKACDEAIEAAGNEFLGKFKEMIAAASDEEFHEFMLKTGKELDEVERMAALCARLESFRNKHKAENEEANEKPERPNGPGVVIIGLG